jgi:DNA-directed RNA polymerase subunit K/omega
MKPRIASRGPIIDTEECVHQAGGGRYDLVLIAAQRLRELKRIHREDTTRYVTPVDALMEVQAGQVNLEDYLAKVK